MDLSSLSVGDEAKKCLELVIQGKDINCINKPFIIEALVAVVQLKSPAFVETQIHNEPPQSQLEHIDAHHLEQASTNHREMNLGSVGMDQLMNICKTHRRQTCKDKNKGCLGAHPQWCPKLSQFGLRKYNKKGCCKTKCNYFHPYMCLASMKTKTCYNRKCKKIHLKGTQRKRNQGVVPQPQFLVPPPNFRFQPEPFPPLHIPIQNRTYATAPVALPKETRPFENATNKFEPQQPFVLRQDFLRLEGMVQTMMTILQQQTNFP